MCLPRNPLWVESIFQSELDIIEVGPAVAGDGQLDSRLGLAGTWEMFCDLFKSGKLQIPSPWHVQF